MPVKVIKKKVEARLDERKVITNLHMLRTKIRLPKNDSLHQNLIHYVRTITPEYEIPDEDASNSFNFINSNDIEVPKPTKIQIPITDGEFSQTVELDQSLTDILQFFKTEIGLNLCDYQSAIINIYHPAKKASDYVTTLDKMTVAFGYRVLIFLCSDELLKYKMLDIKDIKDVLGLPEMNGPLELPEYVERGNAYYFTQQTGMTMDIKMTNKNNYIVQGRQRHELRTKLPTKRYIVSIDFKYTTDIIRSKIKENVESIQKLTSVEPKNKTEQMHSKIAKKMMQNMEQNKSEPEEEEDIF